MESPVQLPKDRTHRTAVILLVAVVVARLGFAALVFARPSLAIQNDSDRYVPIANSIVSGRAYTWDTQRPGELLNTVGYPLFLAGTFLVLGRGTGDIALAQLLLSGIMALLLYFSLVRPIGSSAALISAILLAIDPLTILWSMTILTEVLFAALLGLSGLMLLSWSASGRRRALVFAGVFGGVACLVKPYAELIVGVWAIALLFFPGPHDVTSTPPVANRITRLSLFILPALALVIPWFIRNDLLWDCPTLSSVDRVTMRDYVAAKIVSETEHIQLEEAQANLQSVDPGVCPRNSSAYVGLVLSNPQTYAQLHLAGTLPVLFGTSFDRWLQFLGIEYTLPDLFQPFMDGGVGGVARVLLQEVRRHPFDLGLMLALIAFQLLVYVVAVVGILSFRSAPTAAQRWNIVVVTLAVLILVLTPGQGGHERFRVPVQPLLMILAGYGLAWRILPAIRKFTSRRVQSPVPHPEAAA